MAKYLFEANDTPQGVTGVQSGGSSRRDATRRDAIAKMAETSAAPGGLLLRLGKARLVRPRRPPRHESATAVALDVKSDGRAEVGTVVLLTPEEVDAGAQAPLSPATGFLTGA
jgi:hypothetical protein